MFKKAVAITLSGIILLTPMTASAITWEEIVSGMGSGTYEKDGTRVEQGENGQYTVSGGKIDGTVDLGKLMGKFDLFFKNLQMESGMTIFAGVGTSYKVQLDSDVVVNGSIEGSAAENSIVDLTNNGEITDTVNLGAGGENAKLAFKNVGSVKNLNVEATDGGQAEAVNKGEVTETAWIGTDGENSLGKLTNEEGGTINQIYTDSSNGSTTELLNQGEVEYISANASKKGTTTGTNEGTVNEHIRVGADGEGAQADMTNSGEANRFYGTSSNGGKTDMINEGKVTGDGSTVTVTDPNNGNSWEETSGELNGWSEGKGSITTVINHGSANSSGNGSTDGGYTKVSNLGTIETYMSGGTSGSGSQLEFENSDTGKVGALYGNSEDGASIIVTNEGKVGDVIGVGADGKGSSATVSNNGTAGSMDATGSNGGEVTAANSGVVEGKINVGAGGEGSKAELTNSGEANRIYGDANEGGTTSVTNDGKVTGDGSAITVTDPNSGESWEETSGKLNGRADGEGSSMTVVNNGTVDYEVSVNAEGEGSTAAATNVGTAGQMQINAENGAAATGTNQGTIHEEFGGWANGEGSKTELVNEGNAHISIGGANEGGIFSFENNGELADSFYGMAGGEGSKVDVVNNGKVGVDFQPSAENGGSASAINNGTVGRDLGSEVSSGGTAIITNHGEAAGVGSNVRDEGSSATVINNGTAQEFYIGVWDGGSATGENTGVIEGDMGSGAFGGKTHLENGKDGVVGGTLHVGAGAGGTATAANQGSVGGFDVWADSSNDGMEEAAIYADEANAAEGESASAKGTNEGTISGSANVWSSGNSNAELINNGQANRLDVGAEENGASSVTNNGTIGSAENSSNIEIWLNNGSVSLNNNGEIVPSTSADAQENILAFVKMPDGLSDEQLKQQLESLNIHAGNDPYSVLVQRVAFDEDGNEIVKDYQKITYNEPIQPEQPVQPTQPKFEVPRREIERHEMEERRKDGAIGGVYGSPYWVKQLYLGYHSLNLRLYIGEHQALFRENLSWAGNSMKHLILRVNEAAPEKLTMRFDEDVLLTLERTEFAFITLTDQNGDVLMTYGLGDLRAAYDQYGLSGKDQLVIGGIHDEVMKIGADGQMVSVE